MLRTIIMLCLAHFGIAALVFFGIGLAIRAAMLTQRSLNLVTSLSVVVICFGFELVISFYPQYFPTMYLHDVLCDIGGALFGMILADLYLSFKYESNRLKILSNSIYQRYRNTDKLEYRYGEEV